MIKINNLCYEKDCKKILDGLNFEIKQGEKVVLLGLNGSGKTTLLKILNALYFASSGEFYFESKKVHKNEFTKEFEKAFRQKCTLLFQNYEAMFFCKNIYEDISFSPIRFGMEDVESRVNAAANMFELTGKLDEFAFNLSGGEKQRAALACLFAVSPELLLLDEPTSALDPFWVGRLVEILADYSGSVVCSTHNLSLAAELGDRAIALKDGKIVFDGKTKDIVNNFELLREIGLVHTHKHRHGDDAHEHPHVHDWN